jgi:hypothetical protein
MAEMKQRSAVRVQRLNSFLKQAIIHHEPVAVLQENAVSYSSVTRFCRQALSGLNSEEASSSPKDHRLDEVIEAGLLALSDESFSSVPSVRQTARRISVPKAPCIVDVSILCISQSDIVIGFLKSSPTIRRQVESSCRFNFATSCCPSGIKDEDTD